MKRSVLASIFIVKVLFAVPASATAQLDQDFAMWGALFFTGQLDQRSPSVAFWFDAQARQNDQSTAQVLRPALGVTLSSWASLWLGYASLLTWFNGPDARTTENRLFEQLILKYRKHGVLLMSRTRVEQRWLKEAPGTAHRFRELVRLNYRPREHVPVGIAFKDEVFFQVGGDAWAAQGFEQHRVFLGLATYPVSKLLRIEVGYLNVFLSRETNRMSHVLSINFFLSYPGRQQLF
ncbi:MAG: DUF2490 domain-containing protein [Myxococcota bacterium]